MTGPELLPLPVLVTVDILVMIATLARYFGIVRPLSKPPQSLHQRYEAIEMIGDSGLASLLMGGVTVWAFHMGFLPEAFLFLGMCLILQAENRALLRALREEKK